MQALHIRDVPEPIVAALKRLARRHRRSLQGQLLITLEEAASKAPPADSPPPLALVFSTVAPSGSWSREDLYDDDAR